MRHLSINREEGIRYKMSTSDNTSCYSRSKYGTNEAAHSLYPSWMKGCFDHFGYENENDWLLDVIGYQSFSAINCRQSLRSLKEAKDAGLLVVDWDEARDALPRRLRLCDWVIKNTKKDKGKTKMARNERRRSLDSWYVEGVKAKRGEMEEELLNTFESSKPIIRVRPPSTPDKLELELIADSPNDLNSSYWSKFWLDCQRDSERKATAKHSTCFDGQAQPYPSPDLFCHEDIIIEEEVLTPSQRRNENIRTAESNVNRKRRIATGAKEAVASAKMRILKHPSKDWTQRGHDERCDRLTSLIGREAKAEEELREAEEELECVRCVTAYEEGGSDNNNNNNNKPFSFGAMRELIFD